MSVFKEFLDAVSNGKLRRDLFLVPNKEARHTALVALFNQANERDLCPAVTHTNNRVSINASYATIRIAHEYIHRELKGLIWTGIYGLDALDKYDDIEPVKNALRAQVRDL